MAALRLYHCRHNVRDRDCECDRGISELVYSPEGRRDRQTGRQTNKQTMTKQSNNTKEMTKKRIKSYYVVT